MRTDGLLTAVHGLSEVLFIITQDAALVSYADAGPCLYRPRYYYQSVNLSGCYQLKRIVENPDERLSLQKHYYRAEH